MENNEKNLNEVYNKLKNEYKGIKEIIIENEVILIYADDEILWKIFGDNIDDYRSIEFDADTNESHFIKILP
ncbi:MAG: hypothetical protein ACLQG5_07545 [Methanobacterium sp.]|jgi:hypothetical protein